MKGRKVLNYGLTYSVVKNNGEIEKIDDIHFTKQSLMTLYLRLLDGEPCPYTGRKSICNLKAYVWYHGAKKIEYITNEIDDFLELGMEVNFNEKNF